VARDFVDAERAGHRRRVLFAKPRFWVVVDDVPRARRVDVRFQFAPGYALEPGAPWTRARAPGGRGLWVGTFAGQPVETVARQAWVAPRYGVRVDAPALVSTAAARLALRIVSLFIPVADGTAPAPAVTPATDARGTLCALVFADTGERIAIDDDSLRVEA
jgi:hypothetical protein